MDRYSLRTFGTLTLVGPDERTVLGRHGHHRRRLALLAVLAAAGPRGWSRDQLLLFFWPEATQARARHSLEQLLYALRSSVGEQLFSATNPVVLNPAVIMSDVGEFSSALEREDFEPAVKAYRGPFLDGFYVDGAPEFERWVEEERGRLKGRYINALEHLAENADATADAASAVRWWRTLSEADPLSARSALGYMRALRRVADHAALLQFAEQYEATVSRELGTTVGPAVASMVAEVRAAVGEDRLTRPPSNSAPKMLHAPPVEGATSSDAQGSVGPSARQKLRTGMLVAAAVVAAIAVAVQAARTPDPIPRSIAVLPLTTSGTSAQDSVRADAMSDELITALTRISNLRVTARQSSFAFRGRSLSARQIGDSLRVTHLLEGNFQQDSTRLRVRVRLVDARTGLTIWSAAYDPQLRDVYAMQSDVATSVARELNLRFGPGVAERLRRGLTQNIAAHEAYLRGKDPANSRSDSAARWGLTELERAVALDSTFAAAYAAMPYMHFVLIRHGDAAQARQVQQRAEASARKALALDPELPEAHVGLAVALTMDYTDLRGAERELRQAMALGGVPRIREHLARVLMWSGRHAEALEEAIRAAEEDPLSASAAADVGEGLCVNGRTEEGLAQLDRIPPLKPPLQRVPGYRAACFLMRQDWSRAIAVLEDDPSETPWSVMRGYAVARSGDQARARKMEQEAIAQWRQTGRGAIRVVMIEAGLGHYDQAFEWLDSTQNDRLLSAGLMYPIFRELQSDRRFEHFRRRIGLAAER